MPKELYIVRSIQLVITISTLLFGYSIYQAHAGNISLHRKLNLTILSVVFITVAALVITVLLGWDYKALTTPERMLIHRAFSCPLAIALCLAAYYGWQAERKAHLIAVCFVIPLWIGTLITGLWFF